MMISYFVIGAGSIWVQSAHLAIGATF